MEVWQHFRIFGVLLPVLLFSIGTLKIGPGLATLLGAAELPAAIIASIVVLHESVSCTKVFGVLLILFGSAVPQFVLLKMNVQNGKTP
jgi:drug/metabolite transporter (DMT)-like permease